MFEQPIPKEKFSRLDLASRNKVQSLLMERMIAEKVVDNKIAWVEQYGKFVSDIIDNTDNAEIRGLILEGKYPEAADLILERLLVTA